MGQLRRWVRGWRTTRACRKGWHRIDPRHGGAPYVRRAATLRSGVIVYRFSRLPADENARTVQDLDGRGFTCAECGEAI